MSTETFSKGNYKYSMHLWSGRASMYASPNTTAVQSVAYDANNASREAMIAVTPKLEALEADIKAEREPQRNFGIRFGIAEATLTVAIVAVAWFLLVKSHPKSPLPSLPPRFTTLLPPPTWVWDSLIPDTLTSIHTKQICFTQPLEQYMCFLDRILTHISCHHSQVHHICCTSNQKHHIYCITR